jgi:laminin beta 1
MCRPGFFRYDEDKMCEECVCHPLGTNHSAGPCNPTSGQCICLPNVTGLKCDECIPNHWKIASGEGCESCNCDPQGALRQQCNLFDGQCDCKPGFGGRQCNECMARFFGDPKIECRGIVKFLVQIAYFNCDLQSVSVTLEVQDLCSVT